MKRLLVILALLLYVCMPASANIVSKPFNFVNGTVIDATKVNPDFDTLYTLVNGNIDSTNISNTLGIYASQLLPTTSGQATFGSALGYTFYPNATNQVPLTLIGATGQTADLFDVFLTQAGTKAVWVGPGGVFNTSGAPLFGSPVGIASGGTASSSFTSNTCLRYNGTAIVSASADCLNGTGSLPIVISGSSVTCPTCAVTNANNNFSVGQTIAGNVNLSAGGYQLAGNNILYSDGANTFVQVFTGANAIYFRSSAAANLAHIPNAGGLVLDTGSLTAGSSTYGPTSMVLNDTTAATGISLLASGGFIGSAPSNSVELRAGGTLGSIYVTNNANTSNNAHFPDGGGLVLDRGSLTAGSSTYGSTSATVNGGVTATSFQGGGASTFGFDLGGLGNGNGGRLTTNGATLFRLDSTSAAGASRNWLLETNYAAFGDFHIRTSNANGGDPALAGTDRLAIDPSGNVTGPVNFTATGTIQGASSAATATYVPPIYTPTGTAVANTEHGAQGNCTWGSAATSCTVTLSGPASFAGAGTYNCTANPPAAALMSVIYNTNGNTFVIDFYNTNGSGLASVGASSVFFNCLGT